MALGIFATDLEESKKTSIAGRYLRDFKPELNTRYRIFLPQFSTTKNGVDIERVATLTIAARQFSYKQLGIFSYVYDSDELEIHDDQSFSDLTELRTIERIARILHESQYTAEVAEARERAEREAVESGTTLNEDALTKSRDLIHDKFFGNKDKKEDAKERPIVGAAQKYTYTIGVFVPMTTDGKPEWEKAQTAIWQMSVTRQDNILALYKAEAYKYSGKPYLEFSFDYKGADKKEAGRNAKYEFITPDLSLEAKFPADWKTYGEQLMSTLPTGTVQEMAESIIARTGALHNRNTITDILSKFYAHISTLQTAVIAIKKLDVDYIKKNKKYINMIPSLSRYPAVKDFVDSIVDETEDDESTVAASTASEGTPATPAAPAAAPAEDYSTPITSTDASVTAGITFGAMPAASSENFDDDADIFGDA